MKNIIRKTALLAAGVYSMSREKVEELVEMIREETDDVTEEEGRQMVEDLWSRAQETEKKIQATVEEKVRTAMKRADFVTQDELDELEERVQELEDEL